MPCHPNKSEINQLRISSAVTTFVFEWTDSSTTCLAPLATGLSGCLVIMLQNSAQLAPEVKAGGKTCEDDSSCGAANFLVTITSLHVPEVNHPQSQKLKTSTATTISPEEPALGNLPADQAKSLALTTPSAHFCHICNS